MLIDIKCLLFDMDGTLTAPILDFELIKQDMGIPNNISILEYIDNESSVAKRTDLFSKLDEHELFAAENANPNSGLSELKAFISEQNYKIGVLTRNSRKSAEITLEKLGFYPDILICREDSPYKPKPDAILKALRELNVYPDEAIMIGDFKYDIIAGKNAGTFTCFITNQQENFDSFGADFVIHTLAELPAILSNTKI